MVGMARKRPRDKFGMFQGHPGRLGRCMWKFKFKGQNVRGTDGTHDGTDGTCQTGNTHTHQGRSRQNSSCLSVSFSPQWISEITETTEMTKTTGAPGCKPRLPLQDHERGLEILDIFVFSHRSQLFPQVLGRYETFGGPQNRMRLFYLQLTQDSLQNWLSLIRKPGGPITTLIEEAAPH